MNLNSGMFDCEGIWGVGGIKRPTQIPRKLGETRKEKNTLDSKVTVKRR